MTQKLYLDDSYLIECEATVTACEKTETGWLLQLDQTVFFPTGGGQPHDMGHIGNASVLDVTEEGERVFHLIEMPLPVGEKVPLQIDWARRFDHMQQHSGEHLLSFAAKELFGAVNVGFHMAAGYCTVDFNIPFTPKMVKELEVRTNALVCVNLPVLLTTVDAEELDQLELRKKAKGLAGSVRIVHMPGGDSCTCCGTHVKRTGEIGLIKVTGQEHYKGGERLTFACGARALRHCQQMQDIVSELAREFSCKQEEAPAALCKVQQELARAKRDTRTLQVRLNGYLAAELAGACKQAGKAKVLVRLVDVDAGQLRGLALGLAEKEAPLLALLLARKEEALQYVLCCSKGFPLEVGELAGAVNAALSSKGGGRGTLAQGSGKYAPGVQEALVQLEGYFVSRVKGLKG